MGVMSSERAQAVLHERRAPALWPLAVLAALVVGLSLLGGVPTWPGLVHLVGLPPLDIYTDVRVILVGAHSWPSMLAALLLVGALRVVLLALLLGGLTRDRVQFAVVFYAAVLVPSFAAAQLSYLGFAVLYSRLFWAAVIIIAVLLVITGALPWQGTTRMRTAIALSARAGLRIGVLVGYLAAIMLLSYAAQTWQEATIALVPVSAALTAVTIRLLARPPRRGALLRLAAVAVAATIGITSFLLSPSGDAGAPAQPREGALMLMSGINSSSGDGSVFEVDPEAFGYTCDQVYYYSYAGVGDGHPDAESVCPIRTGAPFTGRDTHRPMAELAEDFAEQVRDLPRPLVVLGHSHSAWVAWLAVSRGMAPEVDAVIMAGPFPESAHGYLPEGESGQGRVASDVFRMLVPVGLMFGFDMVPDAPAFREMLGDQEGPARIMDVPLPGDVRALSLPSASDLPLLPSGWRLPIDYNACPLWEPHPHLPTKDGSVREINRFLDGEGPGSCRPWSEWAATTSMPFGVPSEPAVRETGLWSSTEEGE